MTKDITQKKYKKLSLEVSFSSVSFCIYNLITNKVEAFNNKFFDEKAVIEEELWNFFLANPVVQQEYDEIVVLHQTNLNTFVPTSLFDPSQIGSYLQYNNKVFETDYFAYDYLDNYELNNVFIPYTAINNYLLDQYSTFDFKNSHSIFVKKVLDISKNKDYKQVWIHFQQNKFEIVVTKNQQLLLFNSFQYKTLEDFIYYTLFTYEQLQLNPELVPVHFIGPIDEENEYFKIAFRYIRNCSILDVQNISEQLGVTSKDLLKHFTLFHS